MKGKWRRDLLMDESLREQVERLAERENRSINNMLETLIRRALAEKPEH